MTEIRQKNQTSLFFNNLIHLGTSLRLLKSRRAAPETRKKLTGGGIFNLAG